MQASLSIKDKMWSNPRVIISNGFKNFHLSSAAAEADKRGTLVALFNGLYPKEWIRVVLSRVGLVGNSKIQRLFGRRVAIAEHRVRMFLIAEILNDSALLLSRIALAKPLASTFSAFAMHRFGEEAAKRIRRSRFEVDIYHYRSGFGVTSLKEARKRGAILLCDHSIVHPRLLETLISQRGVLKSATPQSNLDQVWQLVADDIEKADHIVVNSEFVKKTFLFCGIPPNKITVIYLGVDDTFAASIPARQRRSSKSAFRFLFAGTFCHRKGVDILLQAIHQLPKYGWTMRLAGSIDPILTDSLATICANFPVEHLGNLTRRELAQAMSETDAFVFPSFAEGSARVIFEAMACGCYIITTENSGSIVEDGVHGRLVTPGDATALAYAMQTAISDASVQNVGGMNAALIAEKYGQDTYGKRLADLYMSLKCG